MRLPTLALFVAVSALRAAPAVAQSPDAGESTPVLAPRAANPGEGEAQVIRQIDGAFEEDAGAPALTLAAEPSALVDAGTQGPGPQKKEEGAGWELTAGLAASARVTYGGATLFPFDETGTTSAIKPLETRVRVAPELHLGGLGLVAEADAATGAILGVPPVSVVGDRQPVPSLRALELRKLFIEYKWASGVFRVGQQTSMWGLGLLANDGGRDPEAGDFGQQHFGNLTYRALLAARPLFGRGGAFRAFETIFAADLINRDNFGEFAKGDRAFQGVVALRFNKDADNNFGVYAVYRNQRNIFATDGGRATDAFVVDFAGRWQLLKRRHRELKLGWEVVGLVGTTTQARNENAAVLKLGQFGMAIKSQYRVGHTTIFLDGGYASGDQNPADDRVENFRFDRDYKVGLILFDQVMAYQTGRAGVRASDPNLVGVAPEGADLLGTAGSITGAWYLFPRVKLALSDWLDAYGGPLFAFGTALLTDPYNSRIGGGSAINALGGRPGLYLGTELDLGVQARVKPVSALTVTITGEGGLFLPGDAYQDARGVLMGPVAFGRVRFGVSI